MKVLMTTDNLGGVWTYSLELAEALGGLGVEVHLACMGQELSESQRRASSLPNVYLHSRTCKLEWMDEPWADVASAGDWLLELQEQIAPDMVHLNGFAHGRLPWRSPVLVVGHSCVLSWWKAVKGEPAPSHWDVYRQKVREGIRCADFVIAPTRAMLSRLDEHYGPLKRTGVIHNCRRHDAFTSGPKEPIIFSAGRCWDQAKNLSLLPDVATRSRWPMYVAGAGWESRSSPEIRYLGWLEPTELAKWLSKSAIYIHPAKYEPFGLCVLEAALAGCALVLSDIESLHEVWGEAALYADPADAGAFAAQIRRLEADEQLRTQLAHLARQRALRYQPKDTAVRYLEVYDSLGELTVSAACGDSWGDAGLSTSRPL